MVVRDLISALVLPAVNLDLAAEAAAQAERHYAAAADEGLRAALLAAGQAVVDMAGTHWHWPWQSLLGPC